MDAVLKHPGRERRIRTLIGVLWPSFLLAAMGEFAFFAVFDPADLHPFGIPLEAGRLLIYTAFFFFFWVLTAAAAALTLFLMRTPYQVNHPDSASVHR